jgi:proline dehydrogenase
MSANLFHNALVSTMPYVPQSLIWRFSRRYIAGAELNDAFHTVKKLSAAGCSSTIDVLGEDSTSDAQIVAARDLYLETLDGISSHKLDCYASVKLSEMGLRFDVDRCVEVMDTLLGKAQQLGIFVRIDMEDSSVTSITLDIYKELRARRDNVGTVIQSCLRRSDDDIRDLLGSGPTDIRLCKGIYIEPETIAFQNHDEIRSSFCRLLEQMIDGGAARVGIATHDPILVEFAEKFIEKRKLDKGRYEFQMLLGVAEKLRARLVSDGHPLRVYVPFGERWFDYSMRRLRENPQIAGHIVKNMFGGG